MERPTGVAVEIGDREFQIVRDIVHLETGIRLTISKRALVESRLGRRLRALGLSSYCDYVTLLQDERGGAELLELINSITTNKTSFFREGHHFEFLRDQLFPAANKDGREVNIWSAGCSHGAEPYSIAMTALDSNASVRILATDIDTNMLATADAGIYEVEQLSGLPPDTLRRHFTAPDDTKRGPFRVQPAIRSLIAFERLNLIERDWSARDRFDVIFCRNVVIYFDRPTQRGLFERFAERLTPGGVLMVGHSENLAWMPELWEACGRTMYRRRPEGAATLHLPVRRLEGAALSLGARPAPATPARPVVRVEAGGVHASRHRIEIRTTVRSSVAVCLYDPEMGVGGMHHFVFPNNTSARHGFHLIERLIREIVKLGGDRRKLRAKVFGAARRGLTPGLDVGRMNAELVREFLSNESIFIEAEQLGGTNPLEVRMESDTGRVRVRPVGNVALQTAVHRRRPL